MCNYNFVFSEIRVRASGEITPIRAEQSSTKDNNETKYGPSNAIDRNFSTKSYIEPTYSTSTIWFKAILDKIYCVSQIKRYHLSYLSIEQVWDCTESECICVSVKCGPGDGINVTISVDPGTTITNLFPYFSSCKYGNVVKLEKSNGGRLVIVEVAIIVQTQGKFLFCFKILIVTLGIGIDVGYLNERALRQNVLSGFQSPVTILLRVWCLNSSKSLLKPGSTFHYVFIDN